MTQGIDIKGKNNVDEECVWDKYLQIMHFGANLIKLT